MQKTKCGISDGIVPKFLPTHEFEDNVVESPVMPIMHIKLSISDCILTSHTHHAHQFTVGLPAPPSVPPSPSKL